jgi:outer membrane autotransporter protein
MGVTAALKEVQVNGTGVITVSGTSGSDTTLNQVNTINFTSAGTIGFSGGLDTRLGAGELGSVDFNNVDGVFQMGNGSTASTLIGNVTTDTNNNGTVTMVAGTQTIGTETVTSQLGAQGKSLKLFNVGGVGGAENGIDTSTSAFSSTTAYGDVYATGTVLNNNGSTNSSTLIMANGYDLYSTVTTADGNMGVLTLAGGDQIVTGNVGTTGMRLHTVNSGANGAVSNFGSSGTPTDTDVFAVNITNTGTGTSNFSRDVGATNINVNNGISNFTNDVTATTTTIGTGVGNFNTNGTGVTSSKILFSADKTSPVTSDTLTTSATLGSATANLYTGLTGEIDFDGFNGVVNVWNNKSISGAITTTGSQSNKGIVNFRGDGSLASTVGSSAMGIDQLNINTANQQNTTTVNLFGDVWAGSVNLFNNGHVTLKTGVDITGTSYVASPTPVNQNTVVRDGILQVLSTDVNNTGTVVIEGTSVITGVVGALDKKIGLISAGATSTSTTFQNMAYINTLNFSGSGALGSGTIELNGRVGLNASGEPVDLANTTVGGMVGTVDYQSGGGTLVIGDDVNITTVSGVGADTVGIQFANAGSGILRFAGDSVVRGVVGGNTDGRSTLRDIYADGMNNTIVRFEDDVYVSPSSFYVSGTGIVDFQGNLGSATAPTALRFDTQAGQTVTVSQTASGRESARVQFSAISNGQSVTVAGRTLTAATGETVSAADVALAFASGTAAANSTFSGYYSNWTPIGASSTDYLTFVSNTASGDVDDLVPTGILAGTVVTDGNSSRDGSVNVANGKMIYGPVTTETNGVGRLNFVGGTTLQDSIGTNTLRLNEVTFHADTTDSTNLPITSGDVTVNIGQNIYAVTTKIGDSTTAANGTTANITANVFLGNQLILNSHSTPNVILNTAGAVTRSEQSAVTAGTAVSLVDFDHTKNANGTLSGATATDSTTGSGPITTNGSTLNFAVANGAGATPWTSTAGGGLVNTTGSSSITGAAGSSLIMTGTESINLSLLGSLRDNETYTLINTDGGSIANLTTLNTNLRDNSYIIDTSILAMADGDLVVKFDRIADVYVTRSGTSGHFSNPAANRLAALGVAGTGYTEDMQVVFNKLDIDQWGYGNNEANLATQAKRLAPVVNSYASQTAFAATSSSLDVTSERLAVLRGDSKMAGSDGNGRQMGSKDSVWAKVVGGTRSMDSVTSRGNSYDGYRTTLSGLAIGVDTQLENGVVGLTANFMNSSVKQKDFRTGDSSRMGSYGVGLYGTQEYGAAYVEGNLAYNWHNLDQARSTVVGRTANADIDMRQLTARLAAGYRIALDDKPQSDHVLTPMISVEWGNLKQKAYAETGAGDVGLRVDGVTTNRVRASLGLRYNTSFVNGATTYYPELSAAWNTQSGINGTDVRAGYIGDADGTKFTTNGVSLPKSSYSAGAGLRFATSRTSEVQVRYGYEGGKGLDAHMGQVKATWAF